MESQNQNHGETLSESNRKSDTIHEVYIGK